MPRPLRLAVMVLSFSVAALLLAACVPSAQLFTPPAVRFIAEGSGLERLEPPGVGAGAAVFIVNLDVFNANPYGIRLAGLDGTLFLDDERVADAGFVGGLALPADGSGRLTLEVRVPLGEAAALLDELARLVAGEPMRYRLDGTLSVDVLGTVQRLPTVTLAEGEVSQPGLLMLPTVRFDGATTRLAELSLQRAVIEVGFVIDNPSPLGYLFGAPGLELELAGRRIATAEPLSVAVPAGGSTGVVLRFDVGTGLLGAALVADLQRLAVGSAVEVGLVGGFSLEIPGVFSEVYRAGELVSGFLR